jgi:hypothetical protein
MHFNDYRTETAGKGRVDTTSNHGTFPWEGITDKEKGKEGISPLFQYDPQNSRLEIGAKGAIDGLAVVYILPLQSAPFSRKSAFP